MRFYVSPDSIFPEKNLIEIKDRDEIHHARDVMRLEKGAVISVFDGQGREFSGLIDRIDKDGIVMTIKETTVFREVPSLSVTLYQALPKKTKMDFIVEKAVELGADRIVPMITDRTVPDIRDKGGKKTERWMRIGVAASKQCGRVKLPSVSDVMNFKEALIDARGKDLTVFACLDEAARPLKEILTDSKPKAMAIFIGPEGDFSPAETGMARKSGCEICSLGQLVLRVETAAIYLLSAVKYQYTHP